MKEYEAPYFEIALIDKSDVITTSNDSPLTDADDWLEVK